MAQASQGTLPGHTELIDRVAAIVGDRVVLLSEIDEMIQRNRAGGMPVPVSETSTETNLPARPPAIAAASVTSSSTLSATKESFPP